MQWNQSVTNTLSGGGGGGGGGSTAASSGSEGSGDNGQENSSGGWLSNAISSVGKFFSNVGKSVGDAFSGMTDFLGITEEEIQAKDYGDCWGELTCEADSYPDLTEQFNEHLAKIDDFFSPYQDLSYPLKVGVFATYFFVGRNSDFLNPKQALPYKKEGGFYHGEYFEPDDFDNYAYGAAARDMGLDPIVFMQGGGLYRLTNNSKKCYSNIFYFCDDFKDTKMILRGWWGKERNATK